MADVKNYNKVFNDAESYLEEMFERVMPNNITASETELEFAKLQLAALKLINSSSARTKQVMIDINNMFKKGRTSNASKPSVIYKELHSVMSDSKSVSESFLKELTKLRTLYGAMNALLFTSITSEMDVRSQSEIELYKSIAEFKGMPSLEEFGNLPIEEQNTQAAVENRLIDMYRSVAMHPKHAIARITPLEFAGNELKQISNITREKGGFAAAEADLSQPFSTRDHSYQRNVKSKYSFGSKGLGPSALNNTHHVLTQLYNTGIKNSSQLMNTFDDVMLNTIIGKDNVYVQEWLSAFVDGHVDVSADEYMYFLNINETTRNALFSSIRMGDGIKGVLLITQPIIIEAAQRHEGSKKLFGKRKVNPKRLVGSMREELRESLEEVITAQILSDPKFKGATNAAVKLELENRLNELFSSEAVSSYFTDSAMMKNLEVPESKSLEYMAAEIKYLEMFSNYLHIGELLSNLVLNSRVDTGKAGNNITDAVSYLSSVVEVASSEDYINARELLIDSFLGDMLKNNIVTTINTLSDQFITASNYALNITEYVMQSYVDRQFNGDKKRSDLSNAIYSKVISTFFNNKFDNKISNIKKLLKGDNSVAYRILKLKNDPRFAEIKEYEFIKRMNPIIDSKESIDYIMFRKTNDSGINEDMQNEWRQMYNHPDPNISNLAVDLFYYSYFTTGFSPTVFSFFNIVPTSIIHDTGFNDFIREIKPTLASKEATEEDIQDIFLSNTHNTNLVPLLSESAIGQHVMGGRLPLVFSSNHFNVLTSDDTFIRYVQLKDEEGEKVVYKLSGLREGPSGVSGVYAMVPYRGISSKVYNIQGYSYSRNIPTLRANIAAEATAAIKNYDTDALIGLAFRLDNSFDGVTPLPESYSTYRSYSEISGDTSLIEPSEANSDLHTALENKSEEFATPKYIREGTYNINGNKITLTMIGSESSNFNYAIKYENPVPTKEENEEQQNKCK